MKLVRDDEFCDTTQPSPAQPKLDGHLGESMVNAS
jgi:hypothetical protein